LVEFETLLAGSDNREWGLARLLLDHFKDHHGVLSDMVEDPPALRLVGDPKFVAAPTDHGHRTGVGQAKTLAPLQSAKQNTRIGSALKR
jgi:hypothetical protein